MLALIDGDVLAYKAGFASERKGYKVTLRSGKSSLHFKNRPKDIIEHFGSHNIQAMKAIYKVQPVGGSILILDMMIKSIMEDTQSEVAKIYISSDDKSNFRYTVAKTKPYKGNRVGVHKPIHLAALKEHLITKHQAIVVTGQEADDAMGIEQYRATVGSTIICSIDKDMLMIPGKHYNLTYKQVSEVKDPGSLTLERNDNNRYKLSGGGQIWFCAQMIMGDNTDNIPGLDGYGPYRAYELLKDCPSYEAAVRVVYSEYKQALSELTKPQIRARLLEVAQLLWIRREEKGKIFPISWLGD